MSQGRLPVLLDALRERVVADGAMGTMLQTYDLSLDPRRAIGSVGPGTPLPTTGHPEPSTSALIAHHPEAKYVAAT